MKVFLKALAKKLASRKLWVALVAIAGGVMGLCGASSNTITFVSSIALIIFPAVAYIVTEGKIDAAALSAVDVDALLAAAQKYFTGSASATDSGTTAAATYTVTYDDNGAECGMAPTDSGTYSSGASATVLGNTGTLTKTGYIFTGWNTAADGSGTAVAVGATLTISSNVTLYAQWTAAVVSA